MRMDQKEWDQVERDLPKKQKARWTRTFLPKMSVKKNVWIGIPVRQMESIQAVFQEGESLPETVPAKGKERRSFAPKHCLSAPVWSDDLPDGYPSPRSANTFLTPSCDWNHLRPEVTTTQKEANEILVQQELDYQAVVKNIA